MQLIADVLQMPIREDRKELQMKSSLLMSFSCSIATHLNSVLTWTAKSVLQPSCDRNPHNSKQINKKPHLVDGLI